jgi:alkylation response protein AidB-like acyl-CoA dehydrogenase
MWMMMDGWIVRPGRIHHCMRSIGAAQSALNLMLQRVSDPNRKTFGKYLYEHGLLFFVFFVFQTITAF